jgi:hypothetical protein
MEMKEENTVEGENEEIFLKAHRFLHFSWVLIKF